MTLCKQTSGLVVTKNQKIIIWQKQAKQILNIGYFILVYIKPDLKTNYHGRDQRASEKKVRALFNPIPSLKTFRQGSLETTPILSVEPNSFSQLKTYRQVICEATPILSQT